MPHLEFQFINGYPTGFVNSIFRRQLKSKNSPSSHTKLTLNTDTVVLRVPYFVTESQVYEKRVTSAVAKQYPLKKVGVIYDITNPSIPKNSKLSNLPNASRIRSAPSLRIASMYSEPSK